MVTGQQVGQAMQVIGAARNRRAQIALGNFPVLDAIQAVQQGAKPTSTDAFTVDTANARVTYKAVTDGYIADLKGVTGAYIPDGQSLAGSSPTAAVTSRRSTG